MSEIFGEKMKVREAIALLAYGANYEIKGSYSGKIYHKSNRNKAKNVEKYFDREVTDNPFYCRLDMDKDGHYCTPIIGIWMYDYDLCHKKE